MNVHTSLPSWFSEREGLKGKSIGFVPTMGALHAGHVSLLERARRENDIVLLSIFVNPTQFNNPEDFAKYPITIENDLNMAKLVGCDHVIVPTREMMYPDDYRFKLGESDFSLSMEGAHRPGHFDGVLTVVLKLFHIAGCTRAYFGEKDYQQLELIRRMVDALFLDLEIVACPTMREPDGLAMSSRNVRLTPGERAQAPLFFKALSESPSAEAARVLLEKEGFVVDYVEDHGTRRLGAIHLGAVRLIDNVEVKGGHT